MNPQDFKSILDGAKNGGWDFLEGMNPAIKKALDVDQSKAADDARVISAAWARFARSPDGKKALERLFDTTLRRTVFFTALGLDTSSMAAFGSFREGQNSVAHEIARQIAIGSAEKLKPRDV